MSLATSILVLALVAASSCSRANITTMIGNLLPSRTISYQIYAGYEDVNWYAPSTQASVFYTLFECSTRRFADHSAPVIFHLGDGLGLSSQFSAWREFGPVEIIKGEEGYSAVENPWAWNYYGHLVFVDQPIGVGYSYNKGRAVDNAKAAAQHFGNFVWNFLRNSPFGLSANPIYISGSQYAGHFLPAIFQAINSNSSIGFKIQGMLLGNGLVDPQRQINHFQSFLASTGVVSYKQRNLTNTNSVQAIIRIRNNKVGEASQLVEEVWSQQAADKYYNGMSVHNYKQYAPDMQGSEYVGYLMQKKKELGVPDDVTYVQYNKDVYQAFASDMFVSYTSALEYALKSGKRVLIYNGQNNLRINTAGVGSYLQDLQWPGAEQWRTSRKEIWKQSGKIAGWVKRYSNLMFAVVKGAGQFIYEDDANSAKAVYLMLNNYFSNKW